MMAQRSPSAKYILAKGLLLIVSLGYHRKFWFVAVIMGIFSFGNIRNFNTRNRVKIHIRFSNSFNELNDNRFYFLSNSFLKQFIQ